MNDRELLEAAAKAAGYMPNQNWTWSDRAGINGAFRYRLCGDWVEWNPLTDDGDAFRLAVRLGFTVGPHLGATYATIAPCPDDFEDGQFPVRVAQMHNGDPHAAARRAIVRAAAEIGRSME